jgi:hypothetical protein
VRVTASRALVVRDDTAIESEPTDASVSRATANDWNSRPGAIPPMLIAIARIGKPVSSCEKTAHIRAANFPSAISTSPNCVVSK